MFNLDNDRTSTFHCGLETGLTDCFESAFVEAHAEPANNTKMGWVPVRIDPKMDDNVMPVTLALRACSVGFASTEWRMLGGWTLSFR